MMMSDYMIKFINTTKTVPTNFNEKKIASETNNFCILLTVLLITIALLIAVIICRYLTKYQAKENIYYHITSQITNQKKFSINNECIINIESNDKLK